MTGNLRACVTSTKHRTFPWGPKIVGGLIRRGSLCPSEHAKSIVLWTIQCLRKQEHGASDFWWTRWSGLSSCAFDLCISMQVVIHECVERSQRRGQGWAGIEGCLYPLLLLLLLLLMSSSTL